MKTRRLLVFLLAVVLMPVVTGGTAAAETGRQTFVLSELPGDDHIRVTAGGPIRGAGVDEVISEDEDGSTGQIIARDVFRFGPADAVFVTTYPTVTQEFTIDPAPASAGSAAPSAGRSREARVATSGPREAARARSARPPCWVGTPTARARRAKKTSWHTSLSLG